MLNRIGGVERTQTPKWLVEMLRGNHHEGCVHPIQIPNMNHKTFLNPQYTFKPKNLKQEDSLLWTDDRNLNTQICRAE